jgi:hypothetical protein
MNLLSRMKGVTVRGCMPTCILLNRLYWSAELQAEFAVVTVRMNLTILIFAVLRR